MSDQIREAIIYPKLKCLNINKIVDCSRLGLQCFVLSTDTTRFNMRVCWLSVHCVPSYVSRLCHMFIWEFLDVASVIFVTILAINFERKKMQSEM